MSLQERAQRFVKRHHRALTTALVASLLVAGETITPARASNSNDNSDPNSEASNMGNTKRRLEKENKEEKGKESKEKRQREKEREESKPTESKPEEKPRNPIDAAIEACIAEKNKQYSGADYAPDRLNVGFKPEVTLYDATLVVWKERLKYDRPSLYPGLNILVVTGIEKGKVIKQLCRFEIVYPQEVRFAEPDRILRASPSAGR